MTRPPAPRAARLLASLLAGVLLLSGVGSARALASCATNPLVREGCCARAGAANDDVGRERIGRSCCCAVQPAAPTREAPPAWAGSSPTDDSLAPAILPAGASVLLAGLDAAAFRPDPVARAPGGPPLYVRHCTLLL